MFKRFYPAIWPIAFLVCGVIAFVNEGHVHFEVFGKMANLHTLMWFLMALAHLPAFWGARADGAPGRSWPGCSPAHSGNAER